MSNKTVVIQLRVSIL